MIPHLNEALGLSLYFVSLSGRESFPSGQSQVRTPRRGRINRFRTNHPAMMMSRSRPSFMFSLLFHSPSLKHRLVARVQRKGEKKTGNRVPARFPMMRPIFWCRSRDLNPDGFCPLPPQDSVSTRFHHFGIQLASGTIFRLPEWTFAGNLPV